MFSLWFELLTKRRLYFLYLRCVVISSNRFGQNTEVGRVSTQYIPSPPSFLANWQETVLYILAWPLYHEMVGDVLCINLLEVYVQARLPVYSKLSLVNYSSIPATSSANSTLHYGNSFIDEIQIFTDGTFLLYCLNCEMSSCQKHMKFYVVPTVLSFSIRL